VEKAIEAVLEKKGGVRWLIEHPWVLGEPHQLAVHELEHTRCRLCFWRGQRLVLRETVIQALTEDVANEEQVKTLRKKATDAFASLDRNFGPDAERGGRH
jgi:hypothetical protein